MTPYPLTPAETDLSALRTELHRTAADLRRVSRSLRAPRGNARRRAAATPRMRLLRGGLWGAGL